MAETENIVETEATAEVSVNKTEDKKDKKKSTKSNKPGLGAKISKFFKDLISEIKKIVWFGKKQTIKSTGLVIICLVVAAAVISVVDLGLSTVIMWLGSLI